MTNKHLPLLPYLALGTVVVVFLLGIYVGTWVPTYPSRPMPIAITRPTDTSDITPEPITITDTPVSEPSTGPTDGGVACTMEVLECPDGSTTVRNPYMNCEFLACNGDDGHGGDIFDPARLIYKQLEKQGGVDSVGIQHVDVPNSGHVYQAVFFSDKPAVIDKLATQFVQLMQNSKYEASSDNPQVVDGVPTSHFSKQDPLYHGFQMEQRPDQLVINYWWD